jgi:hypothetical protein
LDGREPLIDGVDDARHRPEELRRRAVPLEEEQPAAAGEDLAEFTVEDEAILEAFRDHRQVTRLIQRDRLIADG